MGNHQPDVMFSLGSTQEDLIKELVDFDHAATVKILHMKLVHQLVLVLVSHAVSI